jgi:hypothetical protein
VKFHRYICALSEIEKGRGVCAYPAKNAPEKASIMAPLVSPPEIAKFLGFYRKKLCSRHMGSQLSQETHYTYHEVYKKAG